MAYIEATWNWKIGGETEREIELILELAHEMSSLYRKYGEVGLKIHREETMGHPRCTLTLVCNCGTDMKKAITAEGGHYVCPKCADVAVVRNGKIIAHSTNPPKVKSE